jgi:hypothetical protein
MRRRDFVAGLGAAASPGLPGKSPQRPRGRGPFQSLPGGRSTHKITHIRRSHPSGNGTHFRCWRTAELERRRPCCEPARHGDKVHAPRWCGKRHRHQARAAIPQTNPFASCEFTTIRERLIKIGARVIEHIARIRVDLPTSCPEGSEPSHSACCDPAHSEWHHTDPAAPTATARSFNRRAKMRHGVSHHDPMIERMGERDYLKFWPRSFLWRRETRA